MGECYICAVEQPYVSVVVVNYNVRFFLEQCLRSVETAVQRLEGRYGAGAAEVWVVDNHSVDGSVEMVAAQFPWVRLHANKENLGFSKANNQAIRAGSGKYVLLLNPDTVVEEDTLVRTVEYLEAHEDVGGLGVKMLDGKGRFLPESKRGLPTPAVAFWKIFGLSALFPKSKVFGRYHLGYLSAEKTHEIDVLSGAFMMMRREALDQVGLLDETFFMYGEDIDLSYRIQLGGWKNVYFAGTRIIHYKGESTKKRSANYVFVFYKAMVIFARKHFSKGRAGLFSGLIHGAIWFRAALALLRRLAEALWLPLLDGLLIAGLMYGAVLYWEINHKYVEGGTYPPIFTQVLVPAYVLLWLCGLWFGGAYQVPYRAGKAMKGIIWGTLLILLGYSVLPEHLRFSRMLIFLGAASSALTLGLGRTLLAWAFPYSGFGLRRQVVRRVLLVGGPEETHRVQKLLHESGFSVEVQGFVHHTVYKDPLFAGLVEDLPLLAEVHRVDEIIFCAKDLTADLIMDCMTRTRLAHVDFKIAPSESAFIIGSNSIHSTGTWYMTQVNAIGSRQNRRKKRLFDLGMCLLLLGTVPAGLFVWNLPRFFGRWSLVLRGKNSWIGYARSGSAEGLPKLRPGVLHPAMHLNGLHVDPDFFHRVNLLYAKDFSLQGDWNMMFQYWRELGR